MLLYSTTKQKPLSPKEATVFSFAPQDQLLDTNRNRSKLLGSTQLLAYMLGEDFQEMFNIGLQSKEAVIALAS